MTLPSFATSKALTLGVELELQLIDKKSADLKPAARDLLATMAGCAIPGEVKPELTCGMVELATGICENHAQVLQQLRGIHKELNAAANAIDLGIGGGGTHPFQDWQQRIIYETPRFQELARLYGYLAKQFTVFGQHVHVGCSGADDAMPLLHGLSRYVPHLIALSASSPFVRGEDTGFQSARLNSITAFPLSGRAPFLLTWREFELHFEKLTRLGVVKTMKDIYWDIRPKPEFGTVEVRVMDTPLTLEKAAALAAYIQCLARRLMLEKPFQLNEDDYLPYAFNRFQAARFGMDGIYANPSTGQQRTLREEILNSFDELAPHAAALAAQEGLDFLRNEVETVGSDAHVLRGIFARDRSMHSVVQHQMQSWKGLAS